jgi:hypothetical protein
MRGNSESVSNEIDASELQDEKHDEQKSEHNDERSDKCAGICTRSSSISLLNIHFGQSGNVFLALPLPLSGRSTAFKYVSREFRQRQTRLQTTHTNIRLGIQSPVIKYIINVDDHSPFHFRP